MGELLDGVTWQNLLPFTVPVMGYTDGGYAWPQEAWNAFQGRGSVGISVTGDDGQPVHDCEFGAESPGLAATAAANRWQARTWTTLYSSQDNLPNVTAALRSKSLGWTDAGTWPAPGVYLHVADPSGNIPAGRWSPPVTPVAVQDEWVGPYDHSTTYGTYPLIPTPKPPPEVASMAPLVFTTDFDRNQQVFFVDQEGTLQHHWWGVHTQAWTGPEPISVGWKPGADLVMAQDSLGTYQVWGETSSGGFAQAYWSGKGWVTQPLA